MPVRIVFFSDSHLGFDSPITPRSSRRRRGPDFFANFDRVLTYAVASRADGVLHGGDFFFRSRVHPSIVDAAYARLVEFANSGIPILIVPGNHERSRMPESLFLNHPGIHVFDRPRTVMLTIRGETVAISGFPYLRDVRPRFKDALADCGSNRGADHRLLVFHHAVDGAVVGPADFRFHGAPDVIAGRELPPGVDLVLSGHIHRHQLLRHPTPVLYCGSIERTSFAEKNETKGFCDVTLRAGQEPEIAFHALPARPMVDFDGSVFANRHVLVDSFTATAARWPGDAIARIRLADYPDAALARALTGQLPETMNYQFTRSRG